ncbi:MAG: 50S ribosomal protein L23 [Phycisphaerales bacterium]|nr:50S ribosomal protein L23 [Phycisphaerales bacterium]
MNPTVVLRRPLITEKANGGASDCNRYTFEIDGRANKTDVKDAVKALYKVRVLGVSVLNRKAEDRKTKFGLIAGKWEKRAVVRVHPEDRIELF